MKIKINPFSTNVAEWFIRLRWISGKILMDLIGSAGLTHRIINNSTFPPSRAAFHIAHLSFPHKGMMTIYQDFDHLTFKSAAVGESWPLQTVNICKCWKQDARVQTGGTLLTSPPPTPVFTCLLAWARRLPDRSPASEGLRVPARRSGPLSLMPRLARGPCGSTRQITPPLSHHFCWQNCSPPHYFALSGSTLHPARVLQDPPLPTAPLTCTCLCCSTKLFCFFFFQLPGVNFSTLAQVGTV